MFQCDNKFLVFILANFLQQLSQLTQGQSKEVQGVTITYPQPNTCVCLGLIAGFSSCALGIH
jgi:hypothetical protein